MQAHEMVHHETGRQLHPAVQRRDAAPEALPVCDTIPIDPQTERILRHPCVDRPRLEGHGILLCDVIHQ